MATRDAFIYSETSRKRLDDFLEFIKGLGFSIEDAHGTVHVLDGEGDAHAMSRESFDNEIASRDTLSILLWSPAAESCYCQVRFVAQFRAVNLDLEGTEKHQRDALGSKLIEAALDVQFRGLVFDPEGMTEDYDWHQFFLGNAVLNSNDLAGRLPELLLIRSKLMDRVVGFRIEDWGRGVIRLS